MRSRNHRPKDQLDLLIQQALIDSVAGEEPPAHVWERIRARLTQTDRRPSVRWTGLVLQGALLAFLLMLGSISTWQERLDEPFRAMPSEVAPEALPALGNSDAMKTQIESTGAVVDTVEIALLREYSSLQTRALITEEIHRRAPGIAVPAVDIPPHPDSPQAKALHAQPQTGSGLEGLPVYTPGPIWQ
jgi:hypothetical protein